VLGQLGAGGALQVTPAQGSGLQVPFAQPKEQAVSVGAYVHEPPVHEPEGAYVRRVELVGQVAAGGVLHVTFAQGSVLQAFATQLHVTTCEP